MITPSQSANGDWDNECGYDEPLICARCEGQGYILVCIDDICRGIGECIHGDGYATCPVCKGKGECE